MDARYWFMFPVATITSVAAVSSGIGGAAIFGPTFLLLFPLLGPEYPLASASAAVSTAILVEIFGFSSGVFGYYRRGLIDLRLVLRTAIVSVPVTILASLYIKVPVLGLKILYTAIMLSLSAYMLFLSSKEPKSSTHPSPAGTGTGTDAENPRTPLDLIPAPLSSTTNPLASLEIDAVSGGDGPQSLQQQQQQQPYPAALFGRFPPPQFQSLTEKHRYVVLPWFDAVSVLLSAAGGLLLALIGVGLGEVTVPRFQSFLIPVEVSSAASVSSVAATCLLAATVQFAALIKTGGLAAVPWSLVVWMIPGVILGAQIATTLAGAVSRRLIQRVIGGFFATVGTLFLAVVIKTEASAQRGST